ncbi:winged helix-turn-helix transcriptional regulator [Limosilactobacillus sp.]|uniref:winged helix-turn-helix transcriptional regulator n=1 Tax=Limosilactobacillus sp. TaxID=2773925 RepID=UPI0025BE8E34|nr:helix-turn-helix domain-containing protein [Limosilactobacillus sp.]MCH3921850.1 helix-turn-helix transcriptional regulator [Limosilactobacillus sp.]MCH3928621.1 helix-turn-helix transcriptional regulator [Limosilactobacillus sp.]
MSKAIENCPVDHTMRQIAGKWKGAIILMLLNQSHCRFNELEKKLPNCSRRMLALQLGELVQDGIVAKQVYSTVPPKTSYSLTARGKQLRPIIEGMQQWGSKPNRAPSSAAD